MPTAPAASRPALLEGAPLAPSDLTFPDVLAAAASDAGDQPFLHGLDRGAVATTWTFADTARRVDTLAAALARSGVRPGDTVATASHDPLEVALAILATFRLGAVALALPSPPHPAALAQWSQTLRPAIELARVRALVAPSDLAAPLGAALAIPLTLPPDASAPAHLAERAPTDPDAPALLQFLSGSLRHPSSPVLSHRALLANVRALGAALAINPDDSFVSWLPLHADMGLVGVVLTALVHRVPVFLMRPEAFLVRPALWLRALSDLGGTLSAGPDFAYRLVADRVRPAQIEGCDLSRWRVALTGSERINPATNSAFEALAAPLGLRASALTPAYGLAHAGLAVTACAPDEPWHADLHEYVGLGGPVPGHAVAVTDRDGRLLEQAEVGHIRVRGPSVASAILGPPDPEGPRLDGPWLVTGDEGFITNGELFITGRSKRIAIRRGRNFALADIEAVIAEALGCAGHLVHADVVPGGGRDAESLIVTVPPTAAANPEQLRDAQAALLVNLGLRADRIDAASEVAA